MRKILKKELKQKVRLAQTSLLSRLTDFQLQSDDMEYFHELEELRGVITEYGEYIKHREFSEKIQKALKKCE